MKNNQLELGEIERTLLTAGLWVVSGKVEPSLAVSPELLDTPKLKHRLILRSIEEKLLPMLAEFILGVGWESPAELLMLNHVFRIAQEASYRFFDPVVDRLNQSGIPVIILK